MRSESHVDIKYRWSNSNVALIRVIVTSLRILKNQVSFRVKFHYPAYIYWKGKLPKPLLPIEYPSSHYRIQSYK